MGNMQISFQIKNRAFKKSGRFFHEKRLFQLKTFLMMNRIIRMIVTRIAPTMINSMVSFLTKLPRGSNSLSALIIFPICSDFVLPLRRYKPCQYL